MKLYRLEETKHTNKKSPWKWRVCWLNGYRWAPIHDYQETRESRDKWMDSIHRQAALRLGVDTEVKGFLYSYYLVREPWSEEVLENLIHRVDVLENKE